MFTLWTEHTQSVFVIRSLSPVSMQLAINLYVAYYLSVYSMKLLICHDYEITLKLANFIDVQCGLWGMLFCILQAKFIFNKIKCMFTLFGAAKIFLYIKIIGGTIYFQTLYCNTLLCVSIIPKPQHRAPPGARVSNSEMRKSSAIM